MPKLLLSRERSSGLEQSEPLTSRLVDTLLGEAGRDLEPLSISSLGLESFEGLGLTPDLEAPPGAVDEPSHIEIA